MFDDHSDAGCSVCRGEGCEACCDYYYYRRPSPPATIVGAQDQATPFVAVPAEPTVVRTTATAVEAPATEYATVQLRTTAIDGDDADTTRAIHSSSSSSKRKGGPAPSSRVHEQHRSTKGADGQHPEVVECGIGRVTDDDLRRRTRAVN